MLLDIILYRYDVIYFLIFHYVILNDFILYHII